MKRKTADPMCCAVCYAQSLSHVRLCDPVGCSLSGASVHGISHVRVLERRLCWLLSRVWLFVTPQTVACLSPWHFPCKSTGKEMVLVAQSCLALCDPPDCSLPLSMAFPSHGHWLLLLLSRFSRARLCATP